MHTAQPEGHSQWRGGQVSAGISYWLGLNTGDIENAMILFYYMSLQLALSNISIGLSLCQFVEA